MPKKFDWVKKKGLHVQGWIWARWTAFVTYLLLVAMLPLTALWGAQGAIAGAILTVLMVVAIGWRGNLRIAKRLGAKRLSASDSPVIANLNKELSRRLAMAPPTLAVVQSPYLNIAAFGFRRNKVLVLSSSFIAKMPRDGLCAVLAKELAYLKGNEVRLHSWLSQFLAMVDLYLDPVRPSLKPIRHRYLSIRYFARQTLLYPFCLFPVWLLGGERNNAADYATALRITSNPKALAEGLRLLELTHLRRPQEAPLSQRFLYLIPPEPQSPFLKALFESKNQVRSLISKVEQTYKVVQPFPAQQPA